ncbi:MAG: type II and III secretion system protein family protein [Pseudomonadota bacterium]
MNPVATKNGNSMVRMFCALGLGVASAVYAQAAFSLGDCRFPITVNKACVYHLRSPVDTVSVGNPALADIHLLDPTHLYVLGVSLGSTNVVLGSRKRGFFDTIEVEITHDLDGLKGKLHELFPNEHPKVYSSQGSIVLAGEVSSLEKMDDILAIARTFVHQGEETPTTDTTVVSQDGGPSAALQPGASPQAPKGQGTRVINLMQVGGPQQVMLEVTVAEINRTLTRRLKVDFSAIGATGDFSGGAVRGDALIDGLTQALAVAPGVINPAGLFFRFIGNDVAIKTVINAAKENGLAKVLAEPTLTTISGQEAEFLSGGEFAIPVPQTISQGAGTITIVFKEFGVGVKFLPVVLDSGHISLNLNISVSELSTVNAISAEILGSQAAFIIPSLTKRSATSSVELEDGQTIGIAGLISDNLRESVNKFPGLGDIPIFGQLFTSQNFVKNETELVMFVTPRLAKPIAPDRIRRPTDKFIEPDDVDFYLMGRTEARKRPAPPRLPSGHPSSPSAQPSQGGMSGNFGQQP